jgi:type IV pilus assembly protein PilB
MHWLIRVARQAGLDGAQTLDPQGGLQGADAWSAVSRAAGISQDQLAATVAARLRLNVFDRAELDPNVLRLIPASLARRYNVVPVRETYRELVVATDDPLNADAEQAVGFVSGRRIVFVLAAPGLVRKLIAQHYGAEEGPIERLLGRMRTETADEIRILEDDAAPDGGERAEFEEGPVLKLTSLIIQEAIAARASDIHLAPADGTGTVRIRTDGMIRHYMDLPLPVLTRVISRIKIMGRMDIADRMRPQDGKARIEVKGRIYDLRISVIPTKQAEKAVIRILDPSNMIGLDDSNIAAPELERLRQLLMHREGIIFVTGPTGSGKTTTLYAALREIAEQDVNIITVEDPVEYEMPKAAQIQVEPKRGVTFASALRAILRQDPDVILVGEIRDLETAHIAVQAAMTGHLVLATLHANEAVGVVTRLLDLGLDRPSIAATLRGAVAQRLVRALCTSCREPVGDVLSAEESRLASAFGVPPTYRAAGCSACNGVGYRGRLPELEVLVSTPALADQIARGASALGLQRAAIAGGMRTLREVALSRVAAGLTTLQEVERVLGESAVDAPAAVAETPRILIVEDDPVQARLASALLEKNGFDVIEAGNGLEAWERLGTGGISLVVTDLRMPELDGRELLTRIRRTIATAAIPVIVLTAAGEEEMEVELLEAGADDYIRKPLEPGPFVSRVRAALRRAGSA